MKQKVGDIVTFTFKAGQEEVQRPAIVVCANDDGTLSLSVFIDKGLDGKFGFSPEELSSGISWRSHSQEGTGNGQWVNR